MNNDIDKQLLLPETGGLVTDAGLVVVVLLYGVTMVILSAITATEHAKPERLESITDMRIMI